MVDFNAKTATPDTIITDDDSVLFGADSQSATTPSVYPFGTIKAWVKSWIAKADVGLGNVANIKNNATNSDPTTGSDSGAGYSAGSLWLNTSTGIVWNCVDASVGAAVWLHMLPDSVQRPYYGDANSGIGPAGMMTANLTLTLTASRLFMVPFIVPERRTFSSLMTYLQTRDASVGVTLRSGIYNANQSTRQPTTLIEDLGTYVLDTTTGSVGRKSQAVTATLNPGLYFAAFISDSSAAVISGVTSNWGALGSGLTAGATQTQIGALVLNGVTPGAFSGIHSGDESAQTYGVAGSNYPSFVLR